MLTESEIALFTGGGDVDERLLDAAWYLHAVAGARPDLDAYPADRRRRAHQVSAHIFDVFLQSTVEMPSVDRLRMTFAAQVGYLGGDLTPNASAMRQRIELRPVSVVEDRATVSLEAGVLFLAFGRRELFPALRAWRAELDRLSETWGPLESSPYAAVEGVVRGCYDLLIHLVYGRPARLESAQSRFRNAISSRTAADDTDSRWVAAHLLNLSAEMERSSVWAVTPPDLPAAAQSMTLGEPPVLLLWPPQMRFLTAGQVSPLDPSVRRLALSFPTSAGKTLLAQVLMLTHIARGGRDVCVVAPTHSLCREIRDSVERRVSLVGGTTVDLGPIGLEDLVLPPARVAVMTPEKLAALVHNDPAGTLGRFGMFVIDEAHLLGEGGRGWALEETLSLIHHLTRNTDHRLVVLSAALGNRAHVVQWLDAGNGVVDSHDDWRGPRRLHAIYTTEPRWGDEKIEAAEGPRLARKSWPLSGAIYLRGPEGSSFRGEFSDPVGMMVRRQQRNGDWVRDGTSSTMREHLVPLVEHVAGMGPVLVVQATRSQASRLAQDVAEAFDEHPACFGLAEVAESRVGAGHPLVRVLRKGVAFHHGTLPSDLQAEIEEATRSGRIRVLVATTTLTEGVNLPFKTVIVAERGWGSGGSRVEIIDAGRLLNAVGRAGRAGRETEGWLVLAEQQEFSGALFDPLDRTAEDIELVSTLAQVEALESLAAFEELVAAGEDAVLESTGPAADGLCSYVWFVVEALRELRSQVGRSDVLAALRDTLAWQQFDDALKGRWEAVATRSLDAYDAQPASTRRRWAQSGASLPSAAQLESVADEIVTLVSAGELGSADPSVHDTLAALLGEGRLASLLGLPENRARAFKRRITDPVDDHLAIDVLQLLLDWVAGRELEHLASDHLAEVADDDYRTEQLSEYVASVFQHHVPWTLGIVLRWVNEKLQTDEPVFAADLPAHIHYGVPTPTAMKLMLTGVRSRRLAVRVATAFEEASSGLEVTEWLASSTIPSWRAAFDASPTELSDLLTAVRSSAAGLAAVLLSGEVVSLPLLVKSPAPPESRTVTVVDAEDEPEPRTLLTVDSDREVLGRVPPREHENVLRLLELGVELDLSITSEGRLSISLAESADLEGQ